MIQVVVVHTVHLVKLFLNTLRASLRIYRT